MTKHYELNEVFLKHLPTENFAALRFYVSLQMCVTMSDLNSVGQGDGYVDNGPFSCSQQRLNKRNFRC
jgi:hypothetical protein